MSALIYICPVAMYIVFYIPRYVLLLLLSDYARKTTAAFSGVLAGVHGVTAAGNLHVRTTSSAVIYCCVFCSLMFKVLTNLVLEQPSLRGRGFALHMSNEAEQSPASAEPVKRTGGFKTLFQGIERGITVSVSDPEPFVFLIYFFIPVFLVCT
jgi:hypothetical protein